MARGINKVILIGNLGADPETRAMPSGMTVANIRVATSENWKDKQSGENKERTEWHNVAMFGRLGEIAGEYLKKGSKVYIEGSCARASGRTSRATIATPPRSSPTKCRCSIPAVAAAWAAAVVVTTAVAVAAAVAAASSSSPRPTTSTRAVLRPVAARTRAAASSTTTFRSNAIVGYSPGK